MGHDFRCLHPAHERTGGMMAEIFGRYPACVLIINEANECPEYTAPAPVTVDDALQLWSKLAT